MSSDYEIWDMDKPEISLSFSMGSETVTLTDKNSLTRTFAAGDGAFDYCVYALPEGNGRIFHPNQATLDAIRLSGLPIEELDELDEEGIEAQTIIMQADLERSLADDDYAE